MRPSYTTLALTLLMAMSISACAWFAPTEHAADDAHVVFLTEPDCDYVAVKTQGGRFGIIRPLQPMELSKGDMFVGALRPGHVPLRFLPFPEQELGPEVTVEVYAAGLVFSDTQSLWRRACGIVAPPPPA